MYMSHYTEKLFDDISMLDQTKLISRNNYQFTWRISPFYAFIQNDIFKINQSKPSLHMNITYSFSLDKKMLQIIGLH